MRIFYLVLFVFHVFALSAQIQLPGYRQSWINPDLFEGRWGARWISCPNEPAEAYGVYHFRKTFDLQSVPERFVVHVSADNRYKLYVNGKLISLGPARGDLYNWNFETVDLAPFLRKGKNTLASVVWNHAEHKPIAQMSKGQTGFIVQGNSVQEQLVNTDSTWLSIRNTAYRPWREWNVLGYFALGACEELTAASYPWGWESPDFDDSEWHQAEEGLQGAMKGARDYPGRLLVPSPIPPMDLRMERLSKVTVSEGIECPQGFPYWLRSLEIPANKEVRLLLDNQYLTTGYFSLAFSKGKGAEVLVGYAEALYQKQEEPTTKSYSLNGKGHRDEWADKAFVGYQDRICPDGGEGRLFTSLWWRTWRYVEVKIRTADEPLLVEDIYGTFSAYPFRNETAFSAPGHGELDRMLGIGWRTARLCANETYMDCPYYEQLQYFGDTRIQAMISLYNTSDTCMVRNALEQGRQSMVADGITMSRYPSNLHQFISSFSLWWICSGYDYWMYRGDEAYVRTLLPAYRQILSWYEGMLKPDYSLGYVPHWFFLDWAAGLSHGEPIREKEGNSSVQDLIYLMALDVASKMEEAMGMPAMAAHYQEIAGQIRSSMREKYWDEERRLFADTHDHRSFSQHANALAILAGIVTGNEATALMRSVLADSSLVQCTIYFRYYLHQALRVAGLGDLYLEQLKIWRDQMDLGLTTWAEMPEPSRSDCHAWGASPNIELYRIVLGIDSDAPGFERVCIAPSLGALKEVAGSIPHPRGKVSVSYRLDEQGGGSARIVLPEGVMGRFVWQGKELELKPGEQVISLSLRN